ncbi:MAG: cyclopropane-fatty-acyl-phospholipid synthase family protein [Candidatus Acidiferrales bacterium]
MREWLNRSAKRFFLKSLENIPIGFVEIVCPGGTYSFGDPRASLRALLEIHDERFFLRALLGGDIGIGESFMDGDWSSPDVVSAVRLAIRNADLLEPKNRSVSAVRRWIDIARQRLRSNTISGSRRNIHAHYDLGNDFFRLFLDRSLVYSCACYRNASDSLEEAQIEKLDRVCRKLRLGHEDRVLEIGTGWGAFAFHAARHYGCKVTTTTISRAQHDYVAKSLVRSGTLRNRIELLSEDYRNLRGQYDKIVSIEMFEAVGFGHYDDFFGTCDRLLVPDGTMLLQTITINDKKFPVYRKRSDWTQKYIFPGAQLASLCGIAASLQRSAKMSLFHAEDIGLHYAQTLKEWRSRFHANFPEVRAKGFDGRFIRMWDYYLASSEAAFLERYTSDVQLLLTKNFNQRPLMDEPWTDEQTSTVRMTLSIPA